MGRRAAAIIVDHGCLLLVHRQKPGQDYYVLPGGSIEPGETPEEACVREVKEETGLTVTLARALCVLENRGRLEHYFSVNAYHGELALGEPESTRQAADNRYGLEWIAAADLPRINLQPAMIRPICMESLRGKG